MSAPSAGLRVSHLTKHYGQVAALQDVSLTVAPGEIYGLLGLNGAGKTTALECILGLRTPEAGTIAVGGLDARARPVEARRLLGAQLQSAALPDRITPREALRLFAGFSGTDGRVADLLVRHGLGAKADHPFATLSGGQRQSVLLALALVHEPAVLVLDEPTAGLDARARRELHETIRAQQAAGRAVLLCTHHLQEAQQLCDRIGLLHAGRLLAEGTPAELAARVGALPVLRFATRRPLTRDTIVALARTENATREGTLGWQIATDRPHQVVSRLAVTLERDGNEITVLAITPPALEDVFLALTGRPWPETPETGP